MKIIKIKPFTVVGISVRTTNEDGRSMTDIDRLWQRFISENVVERIPNKVDNTVYSVYTDYESDHTKPYTTVLGCRVKSLDTVPEGFTIKQIEGGDYTVFTVQGKVSEGFVGREWMKIWNASIQRAYTADFEVYDNRARDPENAVVDIFVAVK